MAYQQSSNYGSNYGKRPLWQWILLYVVIGGIVYAGIYYFVIAKRGGYSPAGSTNTNSVQQPFHY